MLGYFDNLLFLRTRFDPGADVSEALRQARDDFLDAYEHHDVPILAVMERQPRLLLLLGDPRNVWVLFHLQVDPESLPSSQPASSSSGANAVAAPRSESIERSPSRSTSEQITPPLPSAGPATSTPRSVSPRAASSPASSFPRLPMNRAAAPSTTAQAATFAA